MMSLGHLRRLLPVPEQRGRMLVSLTAFSPSVFCRHLPFAPRPPQLDTVPVVGSDSHRGGCDEDRHLPPDRPEADAAGLGEVSATEPEDALPYQRHQPGKCSTPPVVPRSPCSGCTDALWSTSRALFSS